MNRSARHPSIFLGSVALPAWSGSGPFPADVARVERRSGRSGPRIEDWQGTGQNYRLVYPSQVNTALAWPATQSESPRHAAAARVRHDARGDVGTLRHVLRRRAVLAGRTRSPCRGSWDSWRCHAAARTPLGPPRAIMTTPNARGSSTNLIDKDGRLWLNFALTGNPALADNRAYLSVDGGPRRVTRYRRGVGPRPFYVGITTDVMTEGTHTVRTWRETERRGRAELLDDVSLRHRRWHTATDRRRRHHRRRHHHRHHHHRLHDRTVYDSPLVPVVTVTVEAER